MKIIKSLVVIVMLIGLAGCIIVNGNGWCCSNNSRAELTFESTMDCSGAKELSCNTCFGKIEVLPSEDNLCKVNAKYWVQAASQERADELILTTLISFEFNNGKITVDLKCPDKKNNESYGADITISVPNEVASHLNTSYGKISVNGLTGKCNANSSFGDIVVESITGDLDLNTSYGKVKVNSCNSDNMKLVTSFADIIIENSTGKVHANTSYGSIKGINLSSGDLDFNTSFGNIYLQAGESAAELKGFFNTSYGHVSLENMALYQGKIDMSTSYGEIKTELPITITGKVSTDSMYGMIGSGNGNVKVRNSFGNIDIKK